MTHRHFCMVLGAWKLENWHLYRECEHHSKGNLKNRWRTWDRVI